MTAITNSTRSLEDQHYETGLLIKNPNLILPNNRVQALQRASYLKKKLQKNGEFHSDYKKFVGDMIEQGNRRKQIHLCSNEECTSIMMLDTINLPPIDCVHLKSVVAPHYKMDSTVLKDLMDKHIISCNKKQWCVEKNEKCLQLNVPYVVHADFSSFGFKTRLYYFSVHTGVKDYFFPI